MNVTHLSCSQCGERYEPGKLYNLCHRCGKPLLVHYDLRRAAVTLTRAALATRSANLWRHREVLPVEQEKNITTLGEGWTPLVHARRLGDQFEMRHLYIKDESLNQCGAKVTLVDGLITDCGRIVAERKEAEGWFEEA